MLFLHQRGLGQREGKLYSDVNRPLIMGADAPFCQWQLNLEREGSLLLSWACLLLCILLQSDALK